MQFYRQALAQNPIVIVANNYEMFRVSLQLLALDKVFLESQAISDGWGFTYGEEFKMLYNSQKFCNIRLFRLSMFGSTINAFPFRYDYNATRKKHIDMIIRQNFASIVRIQLRYKSMPMTREKCHVRMGLLGQLDVKRLFRSSTTTSSARRLTQRLQAIDSA